MQSLSALKTDLSHSRLQVGQQHGGLLMTENLFWYFVIKKLKNSTLSQNWLQTSTRYYYKDLYYSSRDIRILWRRWNKFRNRRRKHDRVLQFFYRPQTGKYKKHQKQKKRHNKIRQSNLVKLLWKENWAARIIKHSFSAVKPSAYVYFRRSRKEKWRGV